MSRSVRLAAGIGLAVSAWLLAIALVAQIVLAGLAVFDAPSWWPRHVAFVHQFQWLALGVVGFALFSRPPRATVVAIVITIVLMNTQYTTAELRLSPRHHAWAALHPLNGFLLLYAVIEVARRAARDTLSRLKKGAPPSVV